MNIVNPLCRKRSRRDIIRPPTRRSRWTLTYNCAFDCLWHSGCVVEGIAHADGGWIRLARLGLSQIRVATIISVCQAKSSQLPSTYLWLPLWRSDASLMRSKNIQQYCQSRCVVRRHSKEKAQVSQWFLAIVGVGDHDAYNHDNIRLTIVDVTPINRNNQALVQIGRSSEFSIPVQFQTLAKVTVVGASSCNWMYPTLDSDRGISQLCQWRLYGTTRDVHTPFHWGCSMKLRPAFQRLTGLFQNIKFNEFFSRERGWPISGGCGCFKILLGPCCSSGRELNTISIDSGLKRGDFDGSGLLAMPSLPKKKNQSFDSNFESQECG